MRHHHYIATDRVAIYGTGPDPITAIEDAKDNGADIQPLTALPCTRALRLYVQFNGTPTAWGEMPDGVQCLDDEKHKSTENGVAFNRARWPDERPWRLHFDVNDFMNQNLDQVDRYIAESLINDPPTVWIESAYDSCTLAVAVWTVGGDTLMYKPDLAAEIKAVAGDYDKVRSDEQRSDLNGRLSGLDRLADAVESAKKRIKKQISDYDQRSD